MNCFDGGITGTRHGRELKIWGWAVGQESLHQGTKWLAFHLAHHPKDRLG
jgi:hypothetical protein